MSVKVFVKFDAPAARLEELLEKYGETMRRVAEESRSKGAIHHESVEDTDGNVLGIDEWESEEAFHAFFDGEQDIRILTAEAGVSGPPAVTSYRVLSTPDRF